MALSWFDDLIPYSSKMTFLNSHGSRHFIEFADKYGSTLS